PNETVTEFDRSNNIWPRNGNAATVSVVQVPPLSIHFVPVKTGNLTGNVTQQNAEQYLAALRLMFPVNEITYTVGEVFASAHTTVQAGGGNWQSVLEEVHGRRTASHAASPLFYGVVRTSYGSGVAGMGYIGFPSAIGWDHLPSGSEV